MWLTLCSNWNEFVIQCVVRQAYSDKASGLAGVIFESILEKTLTMYWTSCQTLLVLLHSGNPQVVSSSPLSGFNSGWKTFDWHTTLYCSGWSNNQCRKCSKTNLYVNLSHRTTAVGKIWRQGNGEPEHSASVYPVSDEEHSVPDCEKPKWESIWKH